MKSSSSENTFEKLFGKKKAYDDNGTEPAEGIGHGRARFRFDRQRKKDGRVSRIIPKNSTTIQCNHGRKRSNGPELWIPDQPKKKKNKSKNKRLHQRNRSPVKNTTEKKFLTNLTKNWVKKHAR